LAGLVALGEIGLAETKATDMEPIRHVGLLIFGNWKVDRRPRSTKSGPGADDE
jgi:hypothetical protein